MGIRYDHPDTGAHVPNYVGKSDAMKSFRTRTALSAAAIVCAGAAHAAVIDFENVDASGAPFAPILASGDFLTQGGFNIQGFDGNGGSGLVGALVNGSDPGTCLDGNCPLGNTSNYYASVDTGAVYIDANGGQLILQSFDAAFLAPKGGVPAGAFGLLAVEADRADGSYSIGAYVLNGPDPAGHTSFQTYLGSNAIYGLFGGSTGTLSSGDVVDLQMFEFYCSSSSLGSCTLDHSNRGQFALDNVTSVPEPSPWLLMGLGLAAVGSLARRRSL